MTSPIEKVGPPPAVDDRPGAAILELRYGLEDRPAAIPSILFGLQHVLIMFTAMIAAPLVISQLLGLPGQMRTTMLSGVMLGCGVGTIISAVGVGWVGSRLPLLLGAYSVYIGPVVAIAKGSSLATASTAMLFGGVVLFLASPLLGIMGAVFPSIVVGTLLLITSETLIRIAANIAAGINSPYAGTPWSLLLAVVSIILILAINRLTTGFMRALSVFIALVCLYIAAIGLGFTDFQLVSNAPWFRLPRILPYGALAWPDASGLITVVLYSLISAIYTTSITIALCKMLGAQSTEARVRGAVAGDGLGSMIAALFGGVPLISYDQNVGAISLTGVGSRFVVTIAGTILIIMALLPKVGALIAIVPAFVLGGTMIFMFGMIAAVGIVILTDSLRSHRDLLLLAVSFGLATATNFAPSSLFASLPSALHIVASDGIVVGTLTAILLNLLLPQDKD